jgi:hypothetical protein
MTSNKVRMVMTGTATAVLRAKNLARAGGSMAGAIDPGGLVSDRGIELTEFIAALRRDLHLSVAGSVGEALRFAVEDIELELEIKATRTDEKSGTGKLKFWVIEAGGGDAIARFCARATE